MHLISLTANKKTFKAVQFNKSGLSLIVGKQKEPEKSDSGKTYNGVGKSLLIALIHFCLGSNTNNALAESIPDWEFTLSFELNRQKYTATRNTSKQNKIYLNNKQLTTKAFKTKLYQEAFKITADVAGLTFRPLIKRFIRPGKESYVSFDTIRGEERNPYQKLLANAFLLGLDVDLVIEKRQLKKDKERVEKLRENLRQDNIFLEFFTENKNVDIELKDIEDKIKLLEADLQAFTIAEDYYEVQKEANQIQNNLQALRNRVIALTNAIENINVSLKIQPDISPDSLFKLYEETKIALPDTVVKQVYEVTEFHTKLIDNRINRLTAERTRLSKEVSELEKEVQKNSNKLDSYLKYLNSNRALDEFIKLSEYVNDLKAKAQKIKDYKDLLESYSNRSQEITIALSQATQKTNRYLKEAKSILDDNLETFRTFSKQFYSNKPGGLTVDNNQKDNQQRFDIKASIEDDSSDGINDVKIFCFDMTLLSTRYTHNINHLVHDSRLFSNIDPRQRATIFKIAYQHTLKSQTQYIATLNEDQITSMRNQFTPEQFKQIIEDNIVLGLTDDSAEGKLLGIQVDMKY